MKHFFSLMIVVITCSQFSYGQLEDTVKLKKSLEERRRMIVTDRPPQAVYFGLGGSGLIFSGNYDRRFNKRPGGPGWTVGMGLWFGDGATIVTVPAALNYLIGRRNNFIELAAGPALVTGAFDLGSSNNTTSANLFWHINAVFRYQPATGGFLFRAGFCPILTREFSFLWYYIGGGVSF